MWAPNRFRVVHQWLCSLQSGSRLALRTHNADQCWPKSWHNIIFKQKSCSFNTLMPATSSALIQGLLHIWLHTTGSRSWNHTRFQLSWQTTVWCILRGLAQPFFIPKTQNYLPYSSLMCCMFLNFETTSSQFSSWLCIMGSRLKSWEQHWDSTRWEDWLWLPLSMGDLHTWMAIH